MSSESTGHAVCRLAVQSYLPTSGNPSLGLTRDETRGMVLLSRSALLAMLSGRDCFADSPCHKSQGRRDLGMDRGRSIDVSCGGGATSASLELLVSSAGSSDIFSSSSDWLHSSY